MHKHITTSLLISSALGLAACGDHYEDIDPPAQLTDRSIDGDALPTEIYYTATPDYRKCVSPVCGGYFLHAVNLKKTTCADGSKVKSEDGCYVSEIDFGGLELANGGLLHGELVEKDYPGFGNFGALTVDALYNPLFDLPHESYSRYNLVRDTGIRCITTPCPSQEIAKLNTPHAWNDGFTFDELASYGGDLTQALDAFYPAYGNGGVIVDSHWHSPWFTGSGWELSVTNVFVREASMCLTVRDAYDDSIVAWNVSSQAQANAIVGDASNWLWVELTDGSCANQAALTLCAADYAPVCGTIDATMETQTYSNECTLTQAVRTAAGENSKATGESIKGECEDDLACHLEDPAYTYVGESPEICQVIKFGCDEGQEFFSDDCGCGCVDIATPAPGEPGTLCGGFTNAQCVAGLECVGLGDNGSTVGTCGCPEFINCFPGPGAPGCASNLQQLCPNSSIVY